MCVIIVKNSGIDVPNKKLLENCWKNNPHGAGFFYLKKGEKVGTISKGYMDFDKYYNALENMNITKDDIVVYHFRIYTSGGKVAEKTHPFPIISDDTLLNALDLEASSAFFHNGIFSGFTVKKDNGLSDSQQFVKTVLYPIFTEYNNMDKTNKPEFKTWFKEKYDKVCQPSNNRTVVIDTTKDLFYLTGNWIDYNGLKISNSSYIANDNVLNKPFLLDSYKYTKNKNKTYNYNDYYLEDYYSDYLPEDYPKDKYGLNVCFCKYCGESLEVLISKNVPIVYCASCNIVTNVDNNEIVWQKK